MAMPAVPHRAVVVVAPTSPPWMHGVAAGRAQLRPLRQHAPGDLVFVGNKVIAEPERIRHTKFTRVALGGGRIQTGKKSDHRQGQTDGETQYPHVFTPKTTRATPALTHPNHEAGWRRWYPGESQMQSELEKCRNRRRQRPQAKSETRLARAAVRPSHFSTAPSVSSAVTLSNAR
jgi:hypothetical protein